GAALLLGMDDPRDVAAPILFACLGEERETVDVGQLELADDQIELVAFHREEPPRGLCAAGGLHVEALLDHPELEDRRLFGIGIDDERAVAVREELRLHVLAEDRGAEEVEDRSVE